MNKHIHHIIPRYMGGTNDKSNLIELTIEEHAEAHRVLFEQHGNWQDYVAWKTLSGQIKSDEIRKTLSRLAWLGQHHTEETKQKIREKRKLQIFSEETRKKMSESQKGRKITWDTKNNTEEARQKRSKSLSGRPKPKLQCPHCNKVGGAPTMKQWHFDNCKMKDIKCT